MPKKKKMLIMEFTIRVYADGVILWDAFDKFLLWKLNQQPQEGLLPYVRKLQGFQNEIKTH